MISQSKKLHTFVNYVYLKFGGCIHTEEKKTKINIRIQNYLIILFNITLEPALLVPFAHLRSNSMGLDFQIAHLYHSLSTKDTIHTTWISVKNIQKYVVFLILWCIFLCYNCWNNDAYITFIQINRNIEFQQIRLMDNALMSHYL